MLASVSVWAPPRRTLPTVHAFPLPILLSPARLCHVVALLTMWPIAIYSVLSVSLV